MNNSKPQEFVPRNPDTGDIVIGLTPQTYGHYTIKEMHKHPDGTFSLKLIDIYDDTVQIWRGSLNSFRKSFVEETEYQTRQK